MINSWWKKNIIININLNPILLYTKSKKNTIGLRFSRHDWTLWFFAPYSTSSNSTRSTTNHIIPVYTNYIILCHGKNGFASVRDGLARVVIAMELALSCSRYVSRRRPQCGARISILIGRQSSIKNRTAAKGSGRTPCTHLQARLQHTQKARLAAVMIIYESPDDTFSRRRCRGESNNLYRLLDWTTRLSRLVMIRNGLNLVSYTVLHVNICHRVRYGFWTI